ncbi:MAG: hypothetical protein PVJ84_13935 [Desulfobacteraceae bacterium]
MLTHCLFHAVNDIQCHLQAPAGLCSGGRWLFYDLLSAVGFGPACRLDETWIPVQAEDFIWFAPFCKQACYGTGLESMEYIYSKDCHRDETV